MIGTHSSGVLSPCGTGARPLHENQTGKQASSMAEVGNRDGCAPG